MTKIGLAGYNTAQGLGYVNRDIARHLGIDRWLVGQHPRFPSLKPIEGIRSHEATRMKISPGTMRRWMNGLDVLLFVENVNSFEDLPRVAKEMGIKVVCTPMVEWIKPEKDWPKRVDLWLAPTGFSFSQLMSREVGGRVEHCPWPIDTTQFEFKQRETCNRFVYAHGNGGPHDRKGGTIVADAARLVPHIPITVYSQVQDGFHSGLNRDVDWPNSIDFRGSSKCPADIYSDGDVFLMPSRFDGLGLQLYESQAAGMPLVCTDGPPMNEANPWVRLPCTPSRVDLAYRYASWDVTPETLASTMESLVGRDIREESIAAYHWVVQNRDWIRRSKQIREMVTDA